MDSDGFSRLSRFSRIIRESTLKRLRTVPVGMENYRAFPSAMSFADITQHLIEADRAYMAALKDRYLGKTLGRQGCAVVEDRNGFDRLIRQLDELKDTRTEFIESLSDDDLWTVISCDRISGSCEEDYGTVLFWLLDHEIQQRGILIAYLKAANGD